MTFLGDRDGDGDGTGRTDKQTDIWTDRLFSENIILDASVISVMKFPGKSVDATILSIQLNKQTSFNASAMSVMKFPGKSADATI